MWSMLDERLRDDLRSRPHLELLLADLESQVRSGAVTATTAVDSVWDAYVADR
jgi:hypothetical protein